MMQFRISCLSVCSLTTQRLKYILPHFYLFMGVKIGLPYKGNRMRVVEKRVLKRICGPKKDVARGCWRKVHNKELHNLYSSPCIARLMQWKRMKLTKHEAGVGWWALCVTFRSESLKERDHSKDRGVDGRIILHCILRKYIWRVWFWLTWLMIQNKAGYCEYGWPNKPSISTRHK
jgi:hypothetical protein